MRRVSWLSWDRARGRAVLYASKLAGAAGMHRFVDRGELRAELLRALGRAGFDAYRTADERARDALVALAPEARLELERQVGASHADARASVQAAERAVAVVSASAAASDRALLAQHVRSAVFTRHGTEREADVLAACGAVAPAPGFVTSADPAFVLSDGTAVHVGGRTDGRRGEELVEVKTRQRRLLGVPLYERVQLHAYMFALGHRRATLVEAYLGERAEHVVEFDDALWREACAGAAETLEACLASATPTPTPTPVEPGAS